MVVVPYFSGERTPINDPRARGVYFGLTLAHTRAHLYRAALEGIGHGVRHHLDVMRSIEAMPSEVIAVGGGAKSDLWLQIVSDICQVQQTVPAVVLGASYGDAFLAGLGAGLFDAPDAIHGWLANARTVTPNRALAALYDRYHDIYLRLYQQNRQAMHELHKLA
ncbi:MAG: FGGY-family carbohydrate kinase [Chloroflexota bacterium]|nr:FGGY-family carbohydrate kinase [Chloroflexota bacterium]